MDMKEIQERVFLDADELLIKKNMFEKQRH